MKVFTKLTVAKSRCWYEVKTGMLILTWIDPVVDYLRRPDDKRFKAADKYVENLDKERD